MTVPLASLDVVRADLALAGYRLEGRPEACTGGPAGSRCETCDALDTKHAIDILALDRRGRPVFIGYRRQDQPRPGGGPPYDYPTITIRKRTARGGSDTEYRKILTGRARFDIFIQSYTTRLIVATVDGLRNALRYPPLWQCKLPDYRHGPEEYTNSYDGTVYHVLCVACMGATEIRRVPLAEAVSA